MTLIPKTCQHCHSYDIVLYKCRLKNKPTGNVDTCGDWKPSMGALTRDKPVFIDYYDKDKNDETKRLAE